MDFGKAFSFVFEDEDWIKKIGVGALLSLTVIGLIPVLGWALEITKRVIKKDDEILPDWSDFGGYITRGFLVFVVVFVYTLPITVLSGCGTGLTALSDSYGEEALTAIALVVTICFSCVTFLYSLAAYLIGVSPFHTAGLLRNHDILGFSIALFYCPFATLRQHFVQFWFTHPYLAGRA